MDKSRHIILRQIVELQTAATGESRQALLDRLAGLGRDRIPAIVAAVLDRMDVPGRTLRIDRLEVTIICGPDESWEDAVARQLPGQLAPLLRSALNARPAAGEEEPTDEAIFFFFLDHGYLPWYAGSDLSLAELEYRLTEALAQNPALARRWAERLRRPVALRRLLEQFSEKMPGRLAGALDETMMKWAETSPPTLSGSFDFWKRFFDQPEAVIAEIRAGKTPLPEPGATKPGQEPATEPDPEPPVPDAGIFFRTAGAILLHPYLPALFRALGCAAENELTDSVKAIFLLHYAATGRDQAAEWELPLAKLLCGESPHRPVPARFALTDFEKREVDQLLETVVGHWKALGKTSPDGLRDGFLQRDGRLKKTEAGWALRVEQRAIDILLDRLPWGLSLVKLPWMPKPVFTEWV